MAQQAVQAEATSWLSLIPALGLKMKRIIGIAAMFLMSCTSPPDRSADHAYVEAQVAVLSPGLALDVVKAHFEQLRKPVEIYNNCKKQSEWPLSPCLNGYTAMGIVPLPSAQGTDQKDQAQVYLTFDSKPVLTHYSYDIYYEDQH